MAGNAGGLYVKGDWFNFMFQVGFVQVNPKIKHCPLTLRMYECFVRKWSSISVCLLTFLIKKIRMLLGCYIESCSKNLIWFTSA
jgi:hypothetical protein